MIYTKDSQNIHDFYLGNYQKYGYSAQSLAWTKGNQNIRFENLTKNFARMNFSILDIGCGFGDLNKYYSSIGVVDYKYVGIDLVEDFILYAQKEYASKKNMDFILGDFLEINFNEEFDYIIASGIFNYKLKEKDNYVVFEDILKKSLSLCTKGVSFDFLSDKVDYIGNDIVFHNAPEKILEIVYKYSRNLILNNSYMPFEYTITVFKDDSFNKDSVVFNTFINENKKKYEEGVF